MKDPIDLASNSSPLKKSCLQIQHGLKYWRLAPQHVSLGDTPRNRVGPAAGNHFTLRLTGIPWHTREGILSGTWAPFLQILAQSILKKKKKTGCRGVAGRKYKQVSESSFQKEKDLDSGGWGFMLSKLGVKKAGRPSKGSLQADGE